MGFTRSCCKAKVNSQRLKILWCKLFIYFKLLLYLRRTVLGMNLTFALAFLYHLQLVILTGFSLAFLSLEVRNFINS